MSVLNFNKAVNIKISNITKCYGSSIILNKVSFTINEGELFTLLGPSGCGKTTTLRIIAGLCDSDKGEVYLGKRMINKVPAWERDVAFVFQSYAIWPFMDIFNNIAFGLKLRKFPKSEIKERVMRIIGMLGLDGLERRSPNQLSGGQLQRVALARSLVVEPPVLLLDEPLSNLDAKVRVEIRQEIRRLQKKIGITMIYVTHDQEEALVISDKIAVMNNGKIEQIGTPMEIYTNPQTPFVATFIGTINSIEGNILKKSENNLAVVKICDNLSIKSQINNNISQGQKVMLFIRPENIEIIENNQLNGLSNKIKGIILQVTFVGNIIRYRIEILEEIILTIEVHNPHNYKMLTEGEDVVIKIDPGDVILIPCK